MDAWLKLQGPQFTISLADAQDNLTPSALLAASKNGTLSSQKFVDSYIFLLGPLVGVKGQQQGLVYGLLCWCFELALLSLYLFGGIHFVQRLYIRLKPRTNSIPYHRSQCIVLYRLFFSKWDHHLQKWTSCCIVEDLKLANETIKSLKKCLPRQ